MASAFFHGYLVNRQPYQVFDEIITFITEDGQKLHCLSLGSRKIESKNSRNLFIGGLIEFEIFQSRSEDKMSRLKKATLLKPLDWNYETIESFNLLNECVNRIEKFNGDGFKFYVQSIEMIINKRFLDRIIVLIILRNFCTLQGLNLEVNKCVKCGSHKLKTISFREHGMLCNLCYDRKRDTVYSLEISKAFHELFNNRYEKLNNYVNDVNFLIKLLSIYINDNLGISLISLKNY